jgi:hypothetical protein
MSSVALNPLNHPTLKKDVNTVETYTSKSSYANAKRHVLCVIENPQDVTMRIAAGTMTGVAVGALAGTVAGAVPALLFPSPVSAEIVLFGQYAGGIIGGVLGGAHEYTVVEYPQVFAQWKQEATVTKVYPIFEKYLGDGVADFMCPYTTSLIANPMVDEHGCVFERADITKDFNAKIAEGKPMRCPKTLKIITQANVVPDLTYHERLLTHCTPLFDKAKNDPNIVAGALALEQQVAEVRSEVLFTKVKGLVSQAVKCKTKAEKEEVLKQIHSHILNAPTTGNKDEKSQN